MTNNSHAKDTIFLYYVDHIEIASLTVVRTAGLYLLCCNMKEVPLGTATCVVYVKLGILQQVSDRPARSENK